MSSKRNSAYRKLLDAWTPSPEFGNPIGCIATTYTFSASFFEEECLARFLQMETDPQREARLYYIEREEKLSGLMGVSVLVDRDHCNGNHNLRWDIVPVAVPGQQGRLHAKVSLLLWENNVRVIIGSANLTESGYRLNYEVFGCLDFNDRSDLPAVLLTEIVKYIEQVTWYSSGYNRKDSTVQKRMKSQLDWIKSLSSRLPEVSSKKNAVRVQFLPTGPGYPTLFESIRENWPSNPLPTSAWIFSPFFDVNDLTEKHSPLPCSEIWNCLKKRNAIMVNYLVDAELKEDDSSYFIHAPDYLKDRKPHNRNKADVWFYRINLRAEDSELRPYHAKGIWLEDDRYVQYIIGSSNFTRQGTGLSNTPNLEANLVFTLNAANKAAYRNLNQSFPDNKYIPYKRITGWNDTQPVSEDESSQYSLLNPFFDEAIFDVDDKKVGVLRLHFSLTRVEKDRIPKEWTIKYNRNHEGEIYNSRQWHEEIDQMTVEVPWDDPAPPTGLLVRDNFENRPAWWPVNVESADALPPVDELRNLPLSVLIDFLTSSRPLHHVMKKYLNELDSEHLENQYEQNVNPLDIIDTSSYLLQRTRRVSWALTALREKLQQPVYTENSLEWRLYGPVGIKQLHKAILKEAKSDEEKMFLSTELALELARIVPVQNERSISADDVRKKVFEVIKEIRAEIKASIPGTKGSIRDYVSEAFREIQL